MLIDRSYVISKLTTHFHLAYIYLTAVYEISHYAYEISHYAYKISQSAMKLVILLMKLFIPHRN